MNAIWRILVQEFALFTVVLFLEAAEFGIEKHETYDPGVFSEQTEGRGILLETQAKIRACFYVERF